jgi:hypothetical protein
MGRPAKRIIWQGQKLELLQVLITARFSAGAIASLLIGADTPQTRARVYSKAHYEGWSMRGMRCNMDEARHAIHAHVASKTSKKRKLKMA